MSFIVPKKPQILYAPMLASFGGGSARGFNPGGGGGNNLLEIGFTETSSGVFLRTTGGTATAELGGSNVTVHVIGAGGWSGRDGMGYGNCGGGGGGGGAVASFTAQESVNIQIGASLDPPGSTYTSGEDGAWGANDTYNDARPSSSQTTWFGNSSLLYGNGGQPGWYGADTYNGQISGLGGTYGGVQTHVGSNGGIGGGSYFSAPGGPSGAINGRNGAQASTYGGGGGGMGNCISDSTKNGASGGLGGVGGEGGVPNGNSQGSQYYRQNSPGTLGSGNGGQAKFMADNETAPFTVHPSSAGAMQITITS